MKSATRRRWRHVPFWSFDVWRFSLGLVALLTLVAPTRSESPNETTKLDCGVNALFVLLHLEGHSVTVDRLEKALPTRHPDGFSMAELSAASRSLGLGLDGVHFVKGDKAFTRPAIAFLKDAKGGHYSVLRPVGSTGTMVQVIDPPHAPWIADYDRVLSAKSWTGRVLIPRDPWPYAALLLAGSGALLLLMTAVARWRRSSATTRASLPAG